MKIPLKPKSLGNLMAELQSLNNIQRLTTIFEHSEPTPRGKYHHWDKLRHLQPPGDLTHEEWWLATKLARQPLMNPLPLADKAGKPFWFAMPDLVQRYVHEIDRDASGRIKISEQVTNPNTRDRYIINSLIEEAITSSQLEGASTTRRVAKEMIRTGRKPADRSEQMIANNFEAMRYVQGLIRKPLKLEFILELHRIVTEDTLDDPKAAGRLRNSNEDDTRVVDAQGNILHVPPPSKDLKARLEKMCEFANELTSNRFIHPVVKSIILHFWIGYDHPFVDGNGRTARALFYWSMLSQGYWLCEFISISRILKVAPAQYARSYLYTETDENDVTYFVIYQLQVIRRAIEELQRYLDLKMSEIRNTEKLIKRSGDLNHRQLAVVSHALKDLDTRITIESHRQSHGVVYQTARTDLLDLVEKGLLEKRKIGNAYFFFAPTDLHERVQSFGS